MDVRIVYCAICGYRGRAERLARRIRTNLAIEATLEHGRLSQFDVFADGALVASRVGGLLNHLTYGGFPDESAVVAELVRLQQAS